MSRGSSVAGSERLESGGPAVRYRSFIYGLFLLVVALPGVVIVTRMLPPELVTTATILPVLNVDFSVQLVPTFEPGEFDASEWLWNLLWDLAIIVFAVVYYAAVAASIVGALLAFAGGLAIASPRTLLESVQNALGFRPVKLLLGFYAVIGLGIFFPAVFRLLGELLIAIAVGVPIAAALGIAWWRVRSTQGTAVRVIVLYPIALGIVILPIAGTALLSPALGPLFRSASTQLAIVILDTVLAVGGLNEWLRATFDLVGVYYFLMWLGLVMIAGWIVGVLTERFGAGILRAIHRWRTSRRR